MGARYAALARKDTKPEIRLRQELHRRGMRYRVDKAVPGLPRRRVDIAFTRVRLAVLVDGCFWHHCPIHGVLPKTNEEWWRWKFSVNQARDADTDQRLADLGWRVMRVWEHEEVHAAADRIEAAVRPPLSQGRDLDTGTSL
ncbi:very short patch repair endonuclease [Actinotalea ferrariae]|uniref:very short patch repair endonuclease n=1 Tax=Actinotalea ferrariae TaxID=1386098 RepID=UPI001FDEF4BE|nr:very short patch repair endonuclease [Actinotalea ferrariae]